MRKENVQNSGSESDRNQTTLTGKKMEEGRVALEYWTKRVNLGDALAPVIYEWMLKRYPAAEQDGRAAGGGQVHLMTVGSILNMGTFDAAVWGSGVLSFDVLKEVYEKSGYRKLDIRAVRGPLTGKILRNAGYEVPEVYGDPGTLMPLIYQPEKREPTVPYTIIPHYLDVASCVAEGYDYLDILTDDYRSFIDRIAASRLVISSSLHGIILAEAYGVPSILLNYPENNPLNAHPIDLLKYYDYYFSTGRKNVKVASSIEEAFRTEPMPLPDLTEIQQKLLESFPYDLFEK